MSVTPLRMGAEIMIRFALPTNRIGNTVRQRSEFEVVNDFIEDAPVDLGAMAAALGLSVDMDADFPPNISGRITRSFDERGQPRYRIEVNGTHPDGRKRFTLAHEIAHYLLHRNLIGDGVTDNELYRSGLPDPIEREADGYAAELLMPSKLVRFAYKAGAIDVASLSAAFNVSYDAMKIRLRQLKLAP